MKKKNSLKNKIASIVLAVASLLPSTSKVHAGQANCDVAPIKRVLETDFQHPLATFDSRTKVNYSANQLVDFVLNESEDDSLPVRLAKTGLDLYASHLTAYISHEAGHEGKDLNFQGGIRKTLTPKVAPTKKTLETLEQRAKYFSSGINQNSINAGLIWENGQRHGNFDDSSFLFNSLYGAFYTLDKDTRSNGNTIDDLEGYCDALSELGIKENPKKLKEKSRIASALTLQNYASVWNIFNYVLRGEANSRPLTFEIKGLEITPPVFSHYLTDEGSYFQGDVFTNPSGKVPIKFSVGVQEDKFRAGAKVYDLKLTDKLSFNPYVYADNSGGHSIGSDLEYRLTNNFNLTSRIEHNHRDILESSVKDKGNGINITAGLKWKF